MNAYGSDGEYPNQLYAMPFGKAVTGNSIIFNISWVAAMQHSISHVLFESATGTYDNTITLNDNISNYKRIKVFYGTDTTGDKIVSADCCEFLPIASTFVLNAITFIGNEGGSSIKTKRFSVAENSFTTVSSGSGIAFTQTNYREQGTQFIKIYKVVGYTVQFSISHYSTTETSTGKTWIDGKAIYRKVIQFGAMSGNNRYTKAHGISYDTIVSFDAIARNSTNSYLPLARVGYNSDSQINASLNGYAYITPDNVFIIGGSQTNYTGATVIIEYTKA